MELELKSIKTFAAMSDETHCYEARLYVDGKPFAQVSNNGCGGPDNVRPLPKGVAYNDPKWNEKLAEVEAFVKTTPEAAKALEQFRKWDVEAGREPRGEDENLYSLESWCADTVNVHLTKRRVKSLLAKKVVWLADGKLRGLGYKRGRKAAPVDAEILGLALASGRIPEGATILNTIAFEEACDLYLKFAA